MIITETNLHCKSSLIGMDIKSGSDNGSKSRKSQLHSLAKKKKQNQEKQLHYREAF